MGGGHLFTYWPPGPNPVPQEREGVVAMDSSAPIGVPTPGNSSAYCSDPVFQVGGIIADGQHSSIPLSAREIISTGVRRSRRGDRQTYHAVLSDFDGSAFFDLVGVWRLQRQPDGAGGFYDEFSKAFDLQCNLTHESAESTVAQHERPDGRYTLTALKDSAILNSDKLVASSRDGTTLEIVGQIIRPPQGLFLKATLEVSDGAERVGIQP